MGLPFFIRTFELFTEQMYMREVDKGTRIANYAVDWIIINVLVALFSIVLPIVSPLFLYYLLFFLYYFLMEFFLGQTVGKLTTRTVVVDINNERPSLRKMLYRTVLRLNPLDGFSYLFGAEQGGHDLVSKTRLVRKNPKVKIS